MKYGVNSLVLCISTRLRLMTILTLLVKYLIIFHADPCNKSYVCRYVGLSMGNPYKRKYVCQNAWAELRGPNTRMLKVSLGSLKQGADYNFRLEFLIKRANERSVLSSDENQ